MLPGKASPDLQEMLHSHTLGLRRCLIAHKPRCRHPQFLQMRTLRKITWFSGGAQQLGGPFDAASKAPRPGALSAEPHS